MLLEYSECKFCQRFYAYFGDLMVRESSGHSLLHQAPGHPVYIPYLANPQSVGQNSIHLEPVEAVVEDQPTFHTLTVY